MTENAGRTRLFDQELKLRIVSAVVMAALVLWMTWIGGRTYSLLWAFLAIAVYVEYAKICAASMSRTVSSAGLAALLLILTAYHLAAPEPAFWVSCAVVAAIAVWELALRRGIWVSAGILYAAIPFLAMSDLRGNDFAGLILTFVLFAAVWGTDIFAFFFGKMLGGPKLAPSISPKKTWSGFVGGFVGAGLLSVAVVRVFGYVPNTAFFALIAIIAFTTQAGDLFESRLKRRFDVKDSGSLIPGHGGILDRIDGLIVSGVIMWLVLEYIQMDGFGNSTAGSAFLAVFLHI